MTITGCYIVKNEAKNLARSIESIRGVCDEIVVVDTGSEDGTVALAQSLGAKVLRFQWVKDFSKARNFALAHAMGDLIIFLDADEWFVPALSDAHKAYLEEKTQGGHQVFFTALKNYDNGYLSGHFHLARIFCNFIGIRYVNAIHEAIPSHAYRSAYLPEEQFLLYHSGYAQSVFHNKIERNLDMLYAGYAQEATPAKKALLCFYIARELGTQERYAEAMPYIDEFFALWDRRLLQNIAIGAHRLRCEFAVALPVQAYPNALCQQYLSAFTQDCPDHPMSKYCEARYAYDRLGDYRSALCRLDEMEAQHAHYDFSLLNDNTNIDLVKDRITEMRANAHYRLGQVPSALDQAICFLQKYPFSNDVFRLLLHLIKEQPPNEIVSFVRSLKPEWTAEEMAGILSQLQYFPHLHEVYLHFAMLHIRQTKEHSDITAVASLLSGGLYDHAIHVAQAMRTHDPQAADALLCTALLCANEEACLRQLPLDFRASRILCHYFSGTPIEDLTLHELDLFVRILRLLLFIDREEILCAALRVLRRYPYERFIILFYYYDHAQRYDKVLGQANFDLSSLPAQPQATCHTALAVAYFHLGRYEEALSQYTHAVRANPGHAALCKDLYCLAAMAPACADRARALTDELLSNARQASEKEDGAAAVIQSVFEKK